MCDSLRGGAYFGGSVHLSLAIIFLVGFIVDCSGIAEVWHNPHSTYLTLILAFMYISLFLVFGLLVFRGIEQESAKILRGTVVGFIVLQFSSFLIYLGITLLLSRRGIPTSATKIILADGDSGSGDGDYLTTPLPTGKLFELETQVESPNVNSSESLSTILDAIDEEEYPPIITVPQIIGLLFGTVATLGYVIVLIIYIRNIGSEPKGRGR